LLQLVVGADKRIVDGVIMVVRRCYNASAPSLQYLRVTDTTSPRSHFICRPARPAFAVGKPRPICFHALMPDGPAHSKFTIQGLVGSKKYWLRVCALRRQKLF